jgi:membrane fusion protein (multidrug efflux system)
VAVVGNDNKVTLKTLKVGERTGAMWIVDEGLKSGERVVVEGVQKVRDSMLVKPTLTTATVEGN